MQAELSVMTDGKVKKMTVKLAQPVRLIPVHIKGRPPSYFIIAGLVFGQVGSQSPVLINAGYRIQPVTPTVSTIILCTVIAGPIFGKISSVICVLGDQLCILC